MNGKVIIHNERVIEFDEPAEVPVVQLRIVSICEYKPAIVFVSCLRSTKQIRSGFQCIQHIYRNEIPSC